MRLRINVVVIRVVVSAFFLFIAALTYCQSFKITIVDSLGKPLPGISVYRSTSGKIVEFRHTNTQGEFEVNTQGSHSDSITLSGFGFREQKMKVADLLNLTNQKVILVPSVITIREVVVENPISKYNDTTRITIDAFKLQTDHKLRDLVDHIPGFKVNDAGELKYNGRTIEKITVGGEDLFASKTSLLTNSLPVHAFSEIEVLENQADDPKLKGLGTGDHVFMNLVLKKDRVKAGFGDAEIGANTIGRGVLDVTAFLLSHQWKAAFIGGFESVGQNTFARERELKPSDYIEAERWMATEPPLQTFYRLPDAYYQYNNLLNANVKLNKPIAKRWMSETEMHLLKDRQSQQFNEDEILLDTSGFISQNLYSQYVRIPLRVMMSQTFKWDISPLKDLKIAIAWAGDFSKADETKGIERTDISDVTENNLKNQTNNFSLDIQYLQRRNENTANLFNLTAFNEKGRQSLYGRSSNYFKAFLLPDSVYSQLAYPINATRSGAAFRITKMVKRKRGTIQWGLISKYEQISYETDGLLTDLDHDLTIPVSEIQSNGRYNSFTLKPFVKYPLRILKMASILNVEVGMQQNMRESPQKETDLQFMYNLALTASRRKRGLFYSLDLKAYDQLPFITSWVQIYRPRSFNSFVLTKPPLALSHYQEIRFRISYLKIKILPVISFGLTRESAGFAASRSLQSNVQFVSDTLFHRPVVNMNITASWTRSWIPSKLQMDAYFFVNRMQYRMLVSDRVMVQQTTNMIWGVEFVKNIKDKYRTTVGTRGDVSLPKTMFPGISPAITFDWDASLKQTARITKSLLIGMNAEYFRANATSKNAFSFTILDVFGDYQFPHSAFSLSASVKNILNQKHLAFTDQEPGNMLYSQIPVIGTHVQVNLRYAL